MSAEAQAAGGTIPPKWTPLGRVERRVLGVLVEKAKTTPDAYPLTLNALTNGCNQKSNRDPQMNLQPDQVENSLEKLRHLSAVIEVSGGGRVSKYRHLIYEWMGINKVEAAVMTELLLRGRKRSANSAARGEDGTYRGRRGPDARPGIVTGERPGHFTHSLGPRPDRDPRLVPARRNGQGQGQCRSQLKRARRRRPPRGAHDNHD